MDDSDIFPKRGYEPHMDRIEPTRKCKAGAGDLRKVLNAKAHHGVLGIRQLHRGSDESTVNSMASAQGQSNILALSSGHRHSVALAMLQREGGKPLAIHRFGPAILPLEMDSTEVYENALFLFNTLARNLLSVNLMMSNPVEVVGCLPTEVGLSYERIICRAVADSRLNVRPDSASIWSTGDSLAKTFTSSGPVLVIKSGVSGTAFLVAGEGKEIMSLAGGRGPFAGTSGGAYSIGLKLLAAIHEHYDGRRDASELVALFEQATECKTARDIRDRILIGRSLRQLHMDIAQIAPIVTHAAREGCREAIRIVRDAASDLLDCARGALLQNHFREPLEHKNISVLLYGAVFLGSSEYANAVVHNLVKAGCDLDNISYSFTRPLHGRLSSVLREDEMNTLINSTTHQVLLKIPYRIEKDDYGIFHRAKSKGLS